MAEVTTNEIIGHGMEAARIALDYCGSLVKEMSSATEDERRAVVVAIAACIAGLNAKLLLNCTPDVYRESQQLILKFMEAASQGIASEIDKLLPLEGKEK